MHVKAKKIAIGGLMLAFSIVSMLLGNILELNTVFFLALASFFVGIIIREFGMKTGCAFYLAGVLLGVIVVPNKLYVVTYAAMGIYILLSESVWRQIRKMLGNNTMFSIEQCKVALWVIKYAIFNLMYIPAVLGCSKLLFGKQLSLGMTIGALIAGQIGLFIYDKAYDYAVGIIWSKIRGKLFN